LTSENPREALIGYFLEVHHEEIERARLLQMLVAVLFFIPLLVMFFGGTAVCSNNLFIVTLVVGSQPSPPCADIAAEPHPDAHT